MILKEKKFLIKSINHNEKWQKKLPPLINSFGLKAYKTSQTSYSLRLRNKKKKVNNI